MGFLRASKAVQRSAKAVLLTVLNAAVLFAAVNVAAALYIHWVTPHQRTMVEIRRAIADEALAKYGMGFFKRLYPNKSEAEIRQLLVDQAESPPAIYEPFAEYRDPVFVSTTLNVHEAGFRIDGVDQGPWPLDPNALNIFVFGGSDIEGSGTDDEHTVPAALQTLLRERTGKTSVNVYNFAVQAYNSTQNVTYFQNQLRYGNVPDIAIFMEGPNDFARWNGETSLSDFYRNAASALYQLTSDLGRDKGFVWHFEELIKALPVETFIRQYHGQTDSQPAPPAPQADAQAASLAADKTLNSDEIYAKQYTDGPDVTSTENIDEAIARLLTNQAIEEGASRQSNIEPLTVWLPNPLYKYDLHYLPFSLLDMSRRARYAYPIMAKYVQQHDMGNSFLWCADIQEDVHEPLYINQGHYNEPGSLLVARCVADDLMRSGALDRAWQKKSEYHETPLQSIKDLAQQNFGSATGSAAADKGTASTSQKSN